MERIRKVKTMIVVVLFTAVLSSAAIPRSYGQGTQTIYFDPQTYIFPSNTPVGTRFNVTVWVNSTSYPWKLMMFQIYIKFNASLINVIQLEGVSAPGNIRAWPNENLGGRSWDEQYVFYGKSGGAIGNPVYYDLGGGMGAVMLGDLIPNDLDIDGPKKLCVIEFEIKVVPPEGTELSSELSLSPSPDTILYNSEGEIANVVLYSGKYIIPEFSMSILLSLMTALSFIALCIKKSRMFRKGVF